MVFKINTLVAAHGLGLEIKQTSVGLQLYEKVKMLKKQLSEEAWSMYDSVLKSCGTVHYDSFKVALETISYMKSSDNLGVSTICQELFNSSELHEIIHQSTQFARHMESFFLKILSGPVPDKISNELNTLKLHRAALNLFYNFHNTKFFSYLHEEIGQEKMKNPIVEEYILSKNPVALSKSNRRLIDKLVRDKNMKDLLYFIEIFDGIKSFVLQLIFETHFDLLLSIEKKDMFKYNEKECSNIRMFKAKTPNIDVFNRGNFLFFYDGETIEDIGLIYKKIVRNMEDEKIRTTIIEGIIYPTNDQYLFANKFKEMILNN